MSECSRSCQCIDCECATSADCPIDRLKAEIAAARERVELFASMLSDVLGIVITVQDYWAEEDYAMLEDAGKLVIKHRAAGRGEGNA